MAHVHIVMHTSVHSLSAVQVQRPVYTCIKSVLHGPSLRAYELRARPRKIESPRVTHAYERVIDVLACAHAVFHRRPGIIFLLDFQASRRCRVEGCFCGIFTGRVGRYGFCESTSQAYRLALIMV